MQNTTIKSITSSFFTKRNYLLHLIPKLAKAIHCGNVPYYKLILPFLELTARQVNSEVALATFTTSILPVIVDMWNSLPAAVVLNPSVAVCKQNLAKLTFSSFLRYPKQFATQKRCGVCHKNTRKGCCKCRVGLHDHCFQQWHGLQ